MIKNKCFKSSIAALSIISLSVMSTFVAMATSQNDSDSSVLMKNVVESDTNILPIMSSPKVLILRAFSLNITSQNRAKGVRQSSYPVLNSHKRV